MKSRLPCPARQTPCRDFIPAYVARPVRRITIRYGSPWKKSRAFPGISPCVSPGVVYVPRVAAPTPALWPRAKATTAPEGQLRSSHGRKPVVADVQVEPEPRQGRLKHVSVAPTGLEQRKGTETRGRSFPRAFARGYSAVAPPGQGTPAARGVIHSSSQSTSTFRNRRLPQSVRMGSVGWHGHAVPLRGRANRQRAPRPRNSVTMPPSQR